MIRLLRSRTRWAVLGPLACIACASPWTGAAKERYERYLAVHPDISAERRRLLRRRDVEWGVTTLDDFLFLYEMRYGEPAQPLTDITVEPLPQSISVYLAGSATYIFNHGILTLIDLTGTGGPRDELYEWENSPNFSK